jgi:CBS domain-containing membrane protein
MSQDQVFEQPVSLIMTTGDIITANVDDQAVEVFRRLKDGQINHVPVLSEGKLVGIVSSSDWLKVSDYGRGTPSTFPPRLPVKGTVDEVMTKNLETIRPTTTIRRAAELLIEGHFHSLLVTASDGELLGIVTSSDIIRTLLDGLPEEADMAESEALPDA